MEIEQKSVDRVCIPKSVVRVRIPKSVFRVRKKIYGLIDKTNTIYCVATLI